MTVSITSNNIQITKSGQVPLDSPWSLKVIGEPFAIMIRFENTSAPGTYTENITGSNLPPNTHFVSCDGQLISTGGSPDYTGSVFAGYIIPNINGNGLGEGYALLGNTTNIGGSVDGGINAHAHTISDTSPTTTNGAHIHGSGFRFSVIADGDKNRTWGGWTGQNNEVFGPTTPGGSHGHVLGGNSSYTGGSGSSGESIIPRGITVKYYMRIL